MDYSGSVVLGSLLYECEIDGILNPFDIGDFQSSTLDSRFSMLMEPCQMKYRNM